MRPVDRHLHMFCSRNVSDIPKCLAYEHPIANVTVEVRESLKGKDYSFTEIAKTVGERWQVLPPDEKAALESRSQVMKDRYYSELAEYKKTQDYADYQQYFSDIKAKHEARGKLLVLSNNYSN